MDEMKAKHDGETYRISYSEMQMFKRIIWMIGIAIAVLLVFAIILIHKLDNTDFFNSVSEAAKMYVRGCKW